jgi:hypothetical protein
LSSLSGIGLQESLFEDSGFFRHCDVTKKKKKEKK